MPQHLLNSLICPEGEELCLRMFSLEYYEQLMGKALSHLRHHVKIKLYHPELRKTPAEAFCL